MKPKEHFHGSDLEKIEAVYGIKKEDIISFSANVNPLGVSFRLRETLTNHIDAITSYPDREYTSLRKCIAEYTGADFENIVVGNGSTELISLFIQIAHPSKALIVGPTYSEYEREVTMDGGRCHYFSLTEDSSFRLDVPALTEELSHNEFAPDVQAVTAIPLTEYYNNIIILRGISKFFAAPGLRLGYAICGNKDLLKEINQKKNPWTINSLAAIAGEIMFSDEEYIQKTRQLIASERERICQAIRSMGAYQVYESNCNFVLVKIKKEGLTADQIFDTAIRQGLMIRDCSTFPFLNDKYFRLCFMMPEDNDRLLAVLKKLAD